MGTQIAVLAHVAIIETIKYFLVGQIINGRNDFIYKWKYRYLIVLIMDK